jgi:hypothetical protein
MIPFLPVVLGIHPRGKIEVIDAVPAMDECARGDVDMAYRGVEVAGFEAHPAPASLPVKNAG